MKWSVGNWFRHVLKNEQDRPVGIIRRRGGEYRFVSLENGGTLTVLRGDGARVYRVIQGEATTAAPMTLASTVGLPPFIAPKAECVELAANGERVRLRQLPKRDFAFAGQKTTGTIRGMLGRTAVIETNDPSEKDAALLYMLARMMLHEDDVDIL